MEYNSFWKIHCFTFFPYKSIRDQIWLPYNRSKSTQGHHLNQLGSTQVPNAAYQLSKSSAFWFQRRRLFKFFTIYGQTAILVMWPGPFEQTFVPPSHGGSIWNLASNGQAVSKEKKFENVESEWGQLMALTFDIHTGSCTHLVNCIYQLWYHRLQ